MMDWGLDIELKDIIKAIDEVYRTSYQEREIGYAKLWRMRIFDAFSHAEIRQIGADRSCG